MKTLKLNLLEKEEMNQAFGGKETPGGPGLDCVCVCHCCCDAQQEGKKGRDFNQTTEAGGGGINIWKPFVTRSY